MNIKDNTVVLTAFEIQQAVKEYLDATLEEPFALGTHTVFEMQLGGEVITGHTMIVSNLFKREGDSPTKAE